MSVLVAWPLAGKNDTSGFHWHYGIPHSVSQEQGIRSLLTFSDVSADGTLSLARPVRRELLLRIPAGTIRSRY